jgi:hypothetical protein
MNMGQHSCASPVHCKAMQTDRHESTKPAWGSSRIGSMPLCVSHQQIHHYYRLLILMNERSCCTNHTTPALQQSLESKLDTLKAVFIQKGCSTCCVGSRRVSTGTREWGIVIPGLISHLHALPACEGLARAGTAQAGTANQPADGVGGVSLLPLAV